MKPLVLQGHSRPIRDIKFTPKGDFVFTASSDRDVNYWRTDTGEKLKTYTHKAAVNRIALSSDLKYMVTGDLTGSLYIWDLTTSFNIIYLEHDAQYGVKSIDFALNDYLIMILYATKGSKNSKSFICVYKFQDMINLANKDNIPEKEREAEVATEDKEQNNDFFDSFKGKKNKNGKNNLNSQGNKIKMITKN